MDSTRLLYPRTSKDHQVVSGSVIVTQPAESPSTDIVEGKSSWSSWSRFLLCEARTQTFIWFGCHSCPLLFLVKGQSSAGNNNNNNNNNQSKCSNHNNSQSFRLGNHGNILPGAPTRAFECTSVYIYVCVCERYIATIRPAS